jgi:hypothetical protein
MLVNTDGYKDPLICTLAFGHASTEHCVSCEFTYKAHVSGGVIDFMFSLIYFIKTEFYE